ncbi:uncharacterized protein C1orf198 homolog [Pectinophora gossypiella]|uniref:DUF4706 domain-containing protein n=1 Tax=Pectinophora gossypiella TaxID=13191 RepID=A0A1E1W4A8_PECGO|nr:uncharacterized protein C1orf198 homolog [Pectinophora gossypiella]XP_049883903.1 uncharacterized protein C1orf198 homolog [Pectinophora gossypiella]XP_049883904.1 uncharacterized protein C1orf198 homolog [Pectinophora gossypiella]XP_049883905.1 uncharacterized protein C1orf198 homolog [Pectinophora gossypiella]XP_049883906.1 uncharacterized protein C1orf198 homolog [Pectinophora gossypiella]XP_049883907.1 uncharacterized protein C1orf198 homolog [Pectinophora gossypiella]XP_049883908.1 un
MALSAVAEEYFRSMNPLAAKIHEDIEEAKNSYENIWETLTDKEKTEIINESIIKPEIALKYALLDSLDFDINDPPVRKDDLMSFFGRDHGQRIVHDDNTTYKDEHSAPFLYQTKSQLNLCVLSEHRIPKDLKTTSPPPVMTELALSHSKVVCELKNALKSHDKLKTYKDTQERDVTSPTGFISKFIGNFKMKDEERECLVTPGPQTQIVASSDNFFRTNFKSPQSDAKFEKDYRSSMVKSNSDLSDENRGLLSSHASSTDFQSTETLTDSVPKTGYDFLDNW